MSGTYAGWSSMLIVGFAMLVLAVRLRLLSPPEVTTRCGACGRLLRRGGVCPCTRPDKD